MLTRGAVIHELNTARTVVPLTDGHELLLAEVSRLLDRMADDAERDQATRARWSRALSGAVRREHEFAQSRLGTELLAVAVAYSAAAWDADSN